MKFSGRYKGNTPVVVDSISLRDNTRSINRIVRDLSDTFGTDWKVWAGGVKEEPVIVG